MNKDNLLGLPIYDKINTFMNLNLNNIDIQRLTGLNENLVMNLTHERKNDIDNKYLNISVKSGQAIADAFDKMVHQGHFPNINPKTPNGLSLSQKIKYVLQLKFNNSELAKMVDITPQQVYQIKKGGSSINGIKLPTAIKFEKLFKQYLYTDDFNFILKDSKLVLKRNVKKDDLGKTIYHTIREYREGNYLIIDTHDVREQISIYNSIKHALDNGVKSFEINHTDNVLNRDFELNFNFLCTIDYGEDECHLEIVNHETKVPFNLFDSSIDNAKAI